MPRIEFGLSMPKQKIVRTLIIERDRAIQETNEALAELAESFSAGLSVSEGGRWMFWSDEEGHIALVYDHPESSAEPSALVPAPQSTEGQGPAPTPTETRPGPRRRQRHGTAPAEGPPGETAA